MENRFKTRISRIFGKPFGSSCRTRTQSSDVVEKTVFLPHQSTTNDGSYSSVSPPKPRPFPTMCGRATCPETAATRVITNCTIPSSRRRRHLRSSGLIPAESPVSPLTRSYYEKKQSTKKQSTRKKKKKRSTQKRETSSLFSTTSSLDSAYFGGSYYWFSSDEKEEAEEEYNGDENGYENDDESDTLFFSSRSFSSDSSGISSRHRRRHHRKNHTAGSGGEEKTAKKKSFGPAAAADGGEVRKKVKGSFAVVKSSSDPYNDFRNSMVEMIIEKQIFGAKDLEQLLQCFLSLNSGRHHRIIVEVFTEIWETLFSNWSFD